MEFTVRRVELPDWRLVREVRLRALSDAPSAFGSTFEEEAEREDFFWKGTVERLAWFVAEDAGEPAGVIAVLPPEIHRQNRFEVISTWVAREHRGAGVGEALLGAALEWARAAGATELTLSVTMGNETARRFYERLGFKPTGTQKPLRSNPTVSALELRLPLAAASST